MIRKMGKRLFIWGRTKNEVKKMDDDPEILMDKAYYEKQSKEGRRAMMYIIGYFAIMGLILWFGNKISSIIQIFLLWVATSFLLKAIIPTDLKKLPNKYRPGAFVVMVIFGLAIVCKAYSIGGNIFVQSDSSIMGSIMLGIGLGIITEGTYLIINKKS
jgi:hypothetical protein